MSNFLETIRHGSRRNSKLHPQQLTTAVILSAENGMYKVVSTGHTWTATAATNQPLNIGDRVYVIQGRGITKIIGLLGSDEDA